jgi:hypothetical protein
MNEHVNHGNPDVKAHIPCCKAGYGKINPLRKKINMQYSVKVISFMSSSV